MSKKNDTLENKQRGFGVETFVFLIILIGALCALGSVMGVGPMFKTIMQTAYSLLLETVLYIVSVCCIMGAIGSLMSEFGVVALAEKVLSPLMRPLFGMPGASSLGVVTTYLSDNPAAVALAEDAKTAPYFKKYQIPALCNLGTTFGMGIIVTAFMIGLGSEYVPAVCVGLVGTVFGGVVSTRLFLLLSKRHYIKEGTWEEMQQTAVAFEKADAPAVKADEAVTTAKKSVFSRAMDAMLEGGKLGWEIGFATTPGVLCICTVIMMLTFGPSMVDGVATYTGAAYEGVAVLPMLGDLIAPVTNVLFGFKDGAAIAFPITALGAVGAAMGMTPALIESGSVGPNEIAVFTAIGITWSGYLSTHISIMDALHARKLIPQALITHTIAGLAAGVFAHYLFLLVG